jgi:hypothetical protein
MPLGAQVHGRREANCVRGPTLGATASQFPLYVMPKTKVRIGCLAAILAEGVDNMERTEQSHVIAECYFDLRRIRLARYEILLAIANLQNVSGKDFAVAARVMDKVSRYETRAVSKRKRALRKANA